MSLRLMWAGPWNERSGIGLFGMEIVRELAARGHHVEVLRTEVGDDLLLPPRPAPGPVHVMGVLPIDQLAGAFDGVIVNLGNHYGFHGGAMPLLQEMAPLVILHDAWMGHFVAGWCQAAGEDAFRVGVLLDGLGRDPSGLAPLCALASGAVVHGPHYRPAVEAACPGPVAYIRLAYTFAALAPPRLNIDRLIVATLGHVNSNKRSDEVIRALGASERLKRSVLYMLIGPVEPAERARLLDLAHRTGGTGIPHFTGWVFDEVLRILLAGIDALCCLRYPALEGGSASLIVAMLSGRPTLVSNHASYAEVPDSCVMKCAPGDEAGDVKRHLETILNDPAAARAMGERARQYASYAYAPGAYATQLLQALDQATRAAPAIRTARAVGRRLAEIGIMPGDPSIARTSVALAELLSGVGTSEHG